MRFILPALAFGMLIVIPGIAVSQNTPSVTIEVRGEYRYITSNGIANHPTGQFPNRGNPNSIQPQQYNFRVPLHPTSAPSTTELERGPFGIAVNGILFDPGTAEFWQDNPDSGWRMEAIGGPRNLGLDQNNAHVQPNGAYHYHSIPTGLIQQIAKDREKAGPLLLGWAADGFPIYWPSCYSDPMDAKSAMRKMKSSYRLKEGNRPGGPGGKYDGAYTADWEYIKESGDLDKCNGRFGVTPENPQGTYYYVITETFPFVPRTFRGTPDESFQRQGPPRGRGPRRGPPGEGPPPRGPRRGFPPPPPQQ